MIVGAGIRQRLGSVAEKVAVEGPGCFRRWRAEVFPGEGAGFVDHAGADVRAGLPDAELGSRGIGSDEHAPQRSDVVRRP